MVALIATTLALDEPDETVRAWFLVALVLCLVGDVFLMLPQDLPHDVSLGAANVATLIATTVEVSDASRWCP